MPEKIWALALTKGNEPTRDVRSLALNDCTTRLSFVNSFSNLRCLVVTSSACNTLPTCRLFGVDFPRQSAHQSFIC